MNKKKIMALLMTSLLVTNLATNVVTADINDNEYKSRYVQMYQSEPIAEKAVPKSEMTATAESWQTGEEAAKAIDGKTSTLWHTAYSGLDIANNPTSITLNLGKVRNVSSIHVTPRQTGNNNGKIKDYKIYAGDKVIAEGTWKSDASTKTVIFNEPVSTDTIRIEAISTIGDYNNKFVSIAEIDVYEAEEAAVKIASAENVKITNGVGGDIKDQLNAVVGKEQGTAIIRFKADNTGLQSLFSISNSSRRDEHFHVYISGGKVGYELRKQSGNVSTGVANASLNKGINTVAFRATKNSGYVIYLNGEKILTVDSATANFLASIEEANSFNLGITNRPSGSTTYNFTGAIDFFEFYDKPLADRYLKEITGQTSAEELPLPEGAIKTDPIDVFKPGELGSNNFRIPSLFTTNKGTVIAGIDVRVGGGHDSPNNIDIGVKRSTDNGQTWDKGQIVLNYPDSASGIDSALVQDNETNEIFMLVDAFPQGGGAFQAKRGTGFSDIEVNGKTVRAMDLTHTDGTKYYAIPGEEGQEFGLVVDEQGNPTSYKVDAENNLYKDNVKIGNTFGASCELKAYLTSYLALISSKDDGLTWSKPKIISGQFKKDWMSFLGTGPGRGYQIKNGDHAGRLIFPVYSLNRNQKQSSAVIYSDDHGVTWKLGESVNDNRVVNGVTIQAETFTGAAREEMTEAQVVEMPNGELKMFMRNPSTSNPAVATSKDGGETWEDVIEYETDLKEPYCQLSIINYEGEIDGKPAVIFANPDSNSRAEGAVQIGLINNIGTEENPVWDFEWKYKQLVKPGYYAYSCLTQLENGNIGLFYEGTATEEMSYIEMNIDYLKADLLADAPTASINSITTLDDVESYNPGDIVNFKVTFDQTVSLIGERSLAFIINGKEVTGEVSRISGNEYKVIITLPEDIEKGSHEITVKANEKLQVVNTIGKVMDLSKDISTTNKILVGVEGDGEEVTETIAFNLKADNKVKAGENLDIKMSLDSISENQEVFAVEANLTYDATKFELGENAIIAIDATKTIVEYKEVEAGNVKVIISSLGNPVVSGSDIINIKLTAKDSTGTSDIAITGKYGNGAGEEGSIEGKNISVEIEENIVVDKGNLEILISEGEPLKEADYTEETWAIFAKAFEKAYEVMNDVDATQEEINLAATSLEEAITGLKRVEKESIFTKHLESAVEMAEAITEEDIADVVPVVKKEFNAALKEAKEILAQVAVGNEVTQEVVNNSFDRLSEAIHMLEHKGNKEKLLNLVNQINDLNSNNFTEASWNALQEVLNSDEVQEVINDENALEADIQKAYTSLYNAFSNLEAVSQVVNKDMLNKLIATVKGLVEEEYISTTWQNLQAVLVKAQEVSDNTKATQQEVDEAYKNLLKGYLGLRLTPNKDKLQELISKAEGLDSNKYTTESFKAVESAIKLARAVFENEEATKEQIKEAEKAVEVAMNNLESKETASAGSSNTGNANNSASSNSSNNNSGNNNSKGNTTLPKTGGTSAVSVGLFGAILAFVGGVFTKKNKK